MNFTKQEIDIMIQALRTKYLDIYKTDYLNEEMKKEELETIDKLIQKFKKPKKIKINFN